VPGPVIHPAYPPEGGVGDLNYLHVQNTPASIWSIVHNLGKRPSVSVMDSAGTLVIGQVIYIDDSALEIHFSAPFGGVASLN
jgi:hypothetical protein